MEIWSLIPGKLTCSIEGWFWASYFSRISPLIFLGRPIQNAENWGNWFACPSPANNNRLENRSPSVSRPEYLSPPSLLLCLAVSPSIRGRGRNPTELARMQKEKRGLPISQTEDRPGSNATLPYIRSRFQNAGCSSSHTWCFEKSCL